MSPAAKKYTDESILTLSSLEHIRARPGMYIGATGNGQHYDDGIYILVKEVVDNAIDEFLMGNGKRVEVKIDYETGRVGIRDYGRGIPLGKVVDCVSKINTGAKYNDDVFQFSAGLNGVGTKAVNALASEFYVRSTRDGEFAEARFKVGILESEARGASTERNGTYVEFVPDPSIFKGFKFLPEHIERRFRMYSYTNPGLTIRLNGEDMRCENGLLDLLNDEVQFEKIYAPIVYSGDRSLEFAFTHTNRFSEEYFSFVNGQYTSDGGTHLSAFREGILKGINEFSPKSKFEPDDVREGLVGAISIRLKEPQFEGQTKTKLGSPEIRSDLVAKVRQLVIELLNRNPQSAQRLVEKIDETRKLRAELNNVKKAARERAKSVSIRVPQLKDSKHHLDLKREKGFDTMIFICEGKSAMGPLVKCRVPETQAVFPLRGKPLNTCELARSIVYKNEELYNLTRALDIEETTDSLRYQKVILATDADVDGLHIRNLMIVFFMRFFKKLVEDGHLYILETPLFRVRRKDRATQRYETRYCYSEQERDDALAELGRSAEVTRFKGLGEISDNEFRTFIAPDTMRLVPIDVSRDQCIKETMQFYEGANTRERRQYILDNLVVNAEDMA